MIADVSALANGDVMGALMRAYDWASTSLGLQERWPQSLLTLVRVMLNSRQPMFIVWGADRTLVYNDSYAPLLGTRHPGALGCPFFETWPEVRGEVGALMDRVFTGDPVHMDDLQLTVHRNGYPEETHFSFSYTPVPGDDGAIVGLFCACTETTRQVLAERQAASERQRQQALLQQMPGFVAVLREPTHIFEYVNDAYVTVAGQRDFIGRNVREVFPELVGQGFYELLDKVFASGEPFAARSLPIRFENETSDRYLDFLYQPIYDETGAVTGIFVGGYEVTDQIRSQAALAESESRYRTLFESIDVGFCIIQLMFDDADQAIDYRILEANPAFVRQTGADVVGKWVSEFAPDLERHWFTAYGRVALTGEPVHFENKADVFGRWFDVRALRVGEPGAHRVAIFFNDISERKRMEVELQVLNATLEQQVSDRTAERDRLWTLSEDMLARANYDGMMSAVSPAWTRVLGWSEAELLSRPYATFMHPEDAEATMAALVRMRETAQPIRYENRIATRDGIWKAIEWTVAPEANSPNFIAVGRDVTATKAHEAELASAQEALRQSQKMEAVGQLTGGLAHDFNNLLTGISGSLDLLQKRVAQGRLNDLDRYLIAAQGASKRAAALTHRLLAFSRRQTLDPKPTDVHKLVLGMTDLIRRTVGPEITVETVDMVGLWPALVDPPQLENALLNLCINARDAMPDGGRITIETANRWMDDRAAREREVAPGQYLSLCVSDTGTGMPPDVVARAFDPFFTTKPLGQGTGLGLSMIYGFARQSGGQVRIYSEVGQGTMVCVYLPRHYGEGSDAMTEADRSDGAPRAVEGETVLVVDDEPTVRMLVTDVLGDLGYGALEAEDGPSGLKILQTGARIDLLVTDVGLPGGMNGRQVADAARVLRPGLKVLFITGYAENAVVGNGHLEPGMAVLTKPFAMDDLATKIRSLIEG